MRGTLLIAVSQANVEPWNSIWRNGQAVTWANQKIATVNVINFVSKRAPLPVTKLDDFHYRNRSKRHVGLWQGRFDYFATKFISRKVPKYVFNEQQSILFVDSWSTWILLGQRLIALYDWFLKFTEFDFLYTTNTSSYINQLNLLKLLESFDSNRFVYAGYLMPENHSKQFVSGAGRLLSRDCVELIRENWHKYTHDNIEDVCIGTFLRDLGVLPINMNTINLPSVESVTKLTLKELETEFHFRCKSQSTPRIDSEIMRALHTRITKELR